MIVYRNTATGSYSSPIGCSNGEYVAHGGSNNTLVNGNSNSGGHANLWINHTQVGTANITPMGSIPRSYVNTLAVQTQIYTVDKTSPINSFGGNTMYTTGYINGLICEIVIFPTALSDAARITIVTSLMTKWGIV